jgi:hypothetical protein
MCYYLYLVCAARLKTRHDTVASRFQILNNNLIMYLLFEYKIDT